MAARAGHQFASCWAVYQSYRVGGCGFWGPKIASLCFGVRFMLLNVIVCWERLDLHGEIRRNRWGSHESVFYKWEPPNSQYLGSKTVINMSISCGKDSGTVLRYYINQSLSTGTNSSFHYCTTTFLAGLGLVRCMQCTQCICAGLYILVEHGVWRQAYLRCTDATCTSCEVQRQGWCELVLA